MLGKWCIQNGGETTYMSGGPIHNPKWIKELIQL
jgi:hypothetical protein